MAGRKVFLREATGLVRNFSAADSFILATSAIIGSLWVPIYVGEWATFPGVNVPLSLVMIGILAVPNALYYVLISSIMPRSGGGGYVPLSRAIHPVLGTAMSFLLMSGFILTVSLNASIIASIAISSPLTTLAAVTGNTALASIGSALATPRWNFLIGIIALTVIALVVIAGNRIISVLNKIAFVIGTAGLVGIVAVLLTTTSGQFQAAYNAYAGSGAYQSMITTAQSSGLTIPANWLTPTLLSLPLSFIVILGYAFNTYYAGEIRRVGRNMTIAAVGSVFFTTGIYAIIALLMQGAFGLDFLNSSAYLSTMVPGKYPLSFAPWVNNFIAIENTSPLLNGLIVASFVSWGYLLITQFFIVIPRHFLAWSFDRVVPSSFGKVSDRFHSPVLAVAVVAILSAIALTFYSFTPAIITVVSVGFVNIMGMTLDGLAGIALPWRRKSIYESAPSSARRKIGGIPVVSILGTYSVVFFVVIVVESFFNPALLGPLGLPTISVLIGGFMLGVVTFLAMKAYNARRGVDITMAFKEIPPE